MATDNNDLLKRFQDLESSRSQLTSQLNEMTGRKRALEEQRTSILSELSKHGISSIEDLNKKILQMQSDLTNSITTLEQKLSQFRG